MLMFIAAILLHISSVYAVSNESDVLLNLKSTVNDPLSNLKSWNSRVHVCNWEGVTCSAERKVIGLKLSSLSLSCSSLASTVNALSYIEELHISQVNFTDTIGSMLLESPSLQVIDLSDNQLHGSFPTQLLLSKNVKHLNLSRNQLDGELVFVVTDVLQSINLSYNNFSGRVPAEFFNNCSNLRYIDFSHNHLIGDVPNDIVTACTALEEVRLAHNNFSGSLNSSNSMKKLTLASNSFHSLDIHACARLEELDISNNKLSGKLNNEKTVCPLLKVLNISRNSLSGTYSSTMYGIELPGLEILDASHNNFTGEVPAIQTSLRYLYLSSNSFNRMRDKVCFMSSKLESLLLPNNRLVSQVLNAIIDCSSLKMLDLSFNEVTGEIPPDMCNKLQSMEYLLLWANRLEGTIPSSLERCVNLTILLLSYNNLHGRVPEELSNLTKLWWLTLSSNKLTGPIPSSFGRLENLRFLQVSQNSLDGNIPTELANCKTLKMLELSGNFLTGSIPPWMGRSSSGIEHAGTTPVETLRVARDESAECQYRDNIFAVQGIDLEKFEELLFMRSGCHSKINFIPSYPEVISSLRLLDVSFNKLTGEIPSEIGNMEDLVAFTTKHNFLGGQVPITLGNLKNLQVLDLSENHLQGSLPDSMSQLTFLTIFNVSYNNLSGRIPQDGQLMTFTSSSYEGNPLLCGAPLLPYCAGQSLATYGPYHEDDDVLIVGIAVGTVAFLVSSITTFLMLPRKVSTLLNSFYQQDAS